MLRRGGVALAALLLAACAQVAPVPTPPGRAVELGAVPFHAQTVHHCGPAALATVLGASGVEVSPQQLAPDVFLPGRKGSLQVELVAATRRYQRVPVRLDGDLDTLVATLEAGFPVLVLQNLGLDWLPRWHYAVAVGFDPAAAALVLRSGTERRLITPLAHFDASWARAGRWALAVAAPGQPPPSAQATEWIAAASALEQIGERETADIAYRAATRQWPASPLAWQARANRAYADGDLPAAEAALRRALQLEPAPATRNNLAQVLIERGCRDGALAQIEAAREAGGLSALVAAALADTAAQAHALDPAADGC